VSSQYISALMMIAPYMQNGLKITLEGTVISKPYIHMTLGMMKEFGVDTNFSENVIEIKQHSYQAIEFTIESDWSAASYWYEILSVAGEGKVFLKGLKKNSWQGDSKVAELFEQLGVKTEYLPIGTLLIPNGKTTDRMQYDFINEPDLAQTFAVTCCLKNIPFQFSGLQSLKIKETNRIAALINELRKLGYVLYEPSEGMLAWNGECCEPQQAISIATYEDHRMAMAFAPAALTQIIEIEHPEVVSKSYPKFWEDLKQISYS